MDDRETGYETVNPIVIEHVRAEDIRGIQAVMKATWLDTYPNEEANITREDIEVKVAEWDSEETIAEKEKTIPNSPENVLQLVARENGKVIGYCRAVKKEPFNKLQVIYVLPEYQGRGIGYQFASKVLEWLGTERDVALEVVKYNESAIQFYKKLGFEIIGDAHNPVADLPSGATMPEFRMVKHLKSETSELAT